MVYIVQIMEINLNFNKQSDNEILFYKMYIKSGKNIITYCYDVFLPLFSCFLKLYYIILNVNIK